ncbi:MAG TPA: PLP-dependent aminotransferase family protein [Burkholderiales bacterium]|nr:PLP-dependent aminotransferase family protein [Burkholderiales bacterium]
MDEQSVLYESVADSIFHMIAAGTLRPGERVPSVRRLSSQKRVSISTVLRAYEVLENRGLIEARPNAGYYVRHRAPAADEPSISRPPAAAHLVGVSALVQEILDARKPGVVSFGAACPSHELMPTQKLRRALASVARRKPLSLTHYGLPPGNEELRRQIARHALDFGCNLSAKDIIVTDGAMEALNLCLRAVARPGDTIALESPTYFGLLQILEMLGVKALEIPTHPRDGISLDALEFALERTKIAAVIVMANAQNPLGFTMPDENKKRLAAMLAKRGVPLIEDDVYGDIYYGEERPFPVKSFDRGGNVMLCSSFTKTVAPGFRLGWVAPGKWHAQVQMGKFINSVGSPEALQLTLAEFLASGGYDRQLRSLRRAFREQVARVSAAVSEHFPAGTRITRPAGGFILWVELPAGCDSIELFHQAMKHNISLGPGVLFSATGRYRNCIRMGCGELWSSRTEQAIAKLGELAGRQL